MSHKKLVIVSHTEHYFENGRLVGWGPTVNEINYLANYWDEVTHVACLFDDAAPPSARPYIGTNIKFVPLPPTGGNTLWKKLEILVHCPKVVYKVIQATKGASHVQFRAPTGIGVFLLPLFSFVLDRKYLFWVKYAGSWEWKRRPLGSRFQRWWLLKNFARTLVTINGFWPDQPEHCVSFENPCLTSKDLERGRRASQSKSMCLPYRLVFVGRLEDAKGVGRIIDALRTANQDRIERIDFVGDGPRRKQYEKRCAFLREKVTFHGFLDTPAVHRILSDAHFILLPSNSEGFPKAIAEAACFGAIPICSNVGSIGHYINENNGFIWRISGTVPFEAVVEEALASDPEALAKKARNIQTLANQFTFDRYRHRLEAEIFGRRHNTSAVLDTGIEPT